jgi:hypothetical protein
MSPKKVPTKPSAKPPEQAPLTRPYWSVDPDKSLDEAKEHYRSFYDEVTRQLNSSPYGEFSVFLSFGYVANNNLSLRSSKYQHPS